MITSIIGIGVVAALWVVFAVLFRVVVPTNEVHILQKNSQTVSFGKDFPKNVYYNIPEWVPRFGITRIILPVSNFDINLVEYRAYDKQRLPFFVDITAFFNIEDSAKAAQRVSSIEELKDHLRSILQGAARTILARSEIESIMEDRSVYGDQFTEEVNEQLQSWGVRTVKSIELMDIRDADGSQVIQNIMEKRKSYIEMESRTEVANNRKLAEIAEIEAKRESDVKDQEAQQVVGIRTAEKDQAVGISNEKAKQMVQEEARITAEKQMAVQQVEDVKAAEIAKEVQIQNAEEYRRTTELRAEGDKSAAERAAEAALITAQKEAEGILAIGTSEAEAKKLAELAIVDPQITLAKEIGENAGYQDYLIQIRKVEKDEVVGIEQAKALAEGDLKVIANSSDVNGGVNKLMDVLTPAGGMSMGQSLEAFASTEAGAALLKKLGVTLDEVKSLF